jgi:hypothetical protein
MPDAVQSGRTETVQPFTATGREKGTPNGLVELAHGKVDCFDAGYPFQNVGAFPERLRLELFPRAWNQLFALLRRIFNGEPDPLRRKML